MTNKNYTDTNECIDTQNKPINTDSSNRKPKPNYTTSDTFNLISGASVKYDSVKMKFRK